jgi:hypothetical protein
MIRRSLISDRQSQIESGAEGQGRRRDAILPRALDQGGGEIRSSVSRYRVPREEGSEVRLSDTPYMNSTRPIDNSGVHMGGMRWAQRHSVHHLQRVAEAGRAVRAVVRCGAKKKGSNRSWSPMIGRARSKVGQKGKGGGDANLPGALDQGGGEIRSSVSRYRVPREEGSEVRLSDGPYMNSTSSVGNSVMGMSAMQFRMDHKKTERSAKKMAPLEGRAKP